MGVLVHEKWENIMNGMVPTEDVGVMGVWKKKLGMVPIKDVGDL